MKSETIKTRAVAVAFLSGGKLRWAPVAPCEGVTPWEDMEARRAVAASPLAIMALSKILEQKGR